MSEFLDYLKDECGKCGFVLTDEMAGAMEVYYDQLIAANKTVNLTAVTKAEDAAFKHFLDSVAPYASLPQGGMVADVGSGAGFPIVPLKIIRPDIDATAIEASQKKCDFIATAATKAGVGLHVVNGRAEELGRGELRERFDVCVSRAVAPLRMLLELCAPLAKAGGLVIAYKGNYEAELEEAGNAMEQLNLELEEIVKLPCAGMEHNTLLLRKTAPTEEKYPRSFARIKKNPL